MKHGLEMQESLHNERVCFVVFLHTLGNVLTASVAVKYSKTIVANVTSLWFFAARS